MVFVVYQYISDIYLALLLFDQLSRMEVATWFTVWRWSQFPQPSARHQLTLQLQDHKYWVPVYSPAFAGIPCAYPRTDGQAELTWVAGCMPRWFIRLQTVTHPSTNWVWHRVTLLIETNALPLSQTATRDTWKTTKKLMSSITKEPEEQSIRGNPASLKKDVSFRDFTSTHTSKLLRWMHIEPLQIGVVMWQWVYHG